jgi:hypothetical protein
MQSAEWECKSGESHASKDPEGLREDKGMKSDTGPNSAGQSGDTQGLFNPEDSDSESVEELLEEGQSFEASIVSGIENARNADEEEVTTRQVSEDDVPDEYLPSLENER